MGGVFVCHASKDAATASALVAALEAAGLACWIAPRDITPGADYTEAIVDAVEAASAVVFLLSRSSEGSQHCRSELEMARNRVLPIVPVLLDDAVPSGGLRFLLSTSQWLDTRDRPAAAWQEELAAALGATVEPTPVAEPVSVATSSTAPVAPSGMVTLLFTDIEGSTRAWEAHPAEMAVALARHDELLRGAIEGAGGFVFKTVGDAFCAAFGDAAGAVVATVTAQRALAAEPWPAETPIRARMGLHSGVCLERDGDYFGQPVNRAARLEAIAHGGQVVLSRATEELVRARLPEGVSLRDLGEHRLKDLGRPEWVFQVCAPGLAEEFEPLRSLSNPALATNLPEQVSSFVGREAELAELRALVGASRLVTLAGPGGSGKTRLALQVAAELVDGSGDGVWLVELAGLADPGLVASEVCRVVGVREEGGRPALELLVDGVRGKDLLVVLDNCEHVVGAAAKLAEVVLRACPQVVVLATSREPLGIAGEQVYRVPSLGLPDAGEDDPHVLASSEAVRMFVERAAQQRAGFELDGSNAATIARLCRRLDGIPMAIELAAARVRSMSLDDLDTRLDERFRVLTSGARTALPRQQTLQALIDWSWDLLNPAEQAVLARLGVFAGGWDLDAASAVVSGDLGGWEVADWEVVDHLDSLVDKSLVQLSDAGTTIRYRLLETVRAYAIGRLAEHGAPSVAATRGAHARYYLALAETAEPELARHGQQAWLERLEIEQDNLRGALSHYLTDPDPEPGLRLAGALRRYWLIRDKRAEAVQILTELVDRPDAQDPTPARGHALNALAQLTTEVEGYAVARVRAEEALAVGQHTHDDRIVALALSLLAWVHMSQNDVDLALGRAAEGLDVARRTGDESLTAALLSCRGQALVGQGDPAEARAHLEEARDLYEQLGDEANADYVRGNLGFAELVAGDLDAARATLEDALARFRAGNQPADAEICAWNLGLVHALGGDRDSARALFLDGFDAAQRQSRPMDTAYALFGLALTAPDPETAVVLHGASKAVLDELGQELYAFELELQTADHARLQAELGDDRFAATYRRGQGLTPEAARTLVSS